MDFNPKPFIMWILGITFFLAVLGIWSFWHWGPLSFPTKETATTTPATSTTTTTTTSNPPKNTYTPPTGPTVKAAIVVYYTSNGFSPTEVRVKAGETVRFVNRNGNTMRVVPGKAYDPGHAAPFNQEASVGYGKTYEFTTSNPGVWLFMNLNNQQHTGTLIVE